MTGQTLLNYCELLNQELQLQSGESDVTRGLLALNVAQDYFESLAAQKKHIAGGGTPVSTVSTTAAQEHTTFPSGVLRVDRLQVLNSSSLPEIELRKLKRAGGHFHAASWPLNLLASSTGKPSHYWTNGTNIYWAPRPDAVYSVRYYGFAVAADITAAGTFAYPDIAGLPLASFAVRLLKGGLDDPAQDVAAIAQETFRACLTTLDSFDRDGASGLEYTEVHNT